MEQSTKTKQGDILRGLNNIDNTHKPNSTLIENSPIEGTPFNWIETQDERFIVLGKYRISPDITDKKPKEWLEEHKWEIIVQLINIGLENLQKETSV